MIRIVIDTNLIIAGSQHSAASKIIDLCLEKKLQAVYSEPIKKENIDILERIRPTAEYLQKIKKFYTVSIAVFPTEKINICAGDKGDNKFFEAAVAGQAQYIVSSDRHLLEHDGYMGIRVKRPREFLKILEGK